MSDDARANQQRLTNAADGWAYHVANEYGERFFDGRATIHSVESYLDAKDDYSHLLNDEWDGVPTWHLGNFMKEVEHAQRTTDIAGGTPVLYVTTNYATATYWNLVLQEAGIATDQAQVVLALQP